MFDEEMVFRPKPKWLMAGGKMKPDDKTDISKVDHDAGRKSTRNKLVAGGLVVIVAIVLGVYYFWFK